MRAGLARARAREGGPTSGAGISIPPRSLLKSDLSVATRPTPQLPSKSRHMTTTVQAPRAPKTATHIGPAIFALAMGGFGIGITEFTMMGLLKEIEHGLRISTPEAGHLISAYALGVVVGAPVLAAVGAKLPRKYLALGLMLFFSVANLSSFIAPGLRNHAGLPVRCRAAARRLLRCRRGDRRFPGGADQAWLGDLHGDGRAYGRQRHRCSRSPRGSARPMAGGCSLSWWDASGTGHPGTALEVRAVPEGARRRQHPPGAGRAQAGPGLAGDPHRHRGFRRLLRHLHLHLPHHDLRGRDSRHACCRSWWPSTAWAWWPAISSAAGSRTSP